MNVQDEIRNHLLVRFPPELVNSLIDNYLELKEKFILSEYREASLYGGRFAEIALRVCQYIIDGQYTKIGDPLPRFHNEVDRLGRTKRGVNHDSYRLYVPKSLDILYDIRNNRNVGHSGGDVDENFADANMSLILSSWVLTELIRLNYVGNIDEAQKLVNNLIRIKVPLIQDFNGFLRILNPKIPLQHKIIALELYRKDDGLTSNQLIRYLNVNHQSGPIKRALTLLVRSAMLHYNDVEDKYYITEKAIRFVEENIRFEI